VNDNGQLSIPADNPFTGQSSARNEIWSYGLRNPWRFSFDRQNGDLYIADVGQNAREEIDVATQSDQFGKGLNFGWNRMEGTACYLPSSGCDRSGLTLPVLDYSHSDGCSVTGGYVYRGSTVPSLAGLYFYSDYCSGWIRSFRLAGGSATAQRDWPELNPGGGVSSFGEDARGELYVMTSAVVYRIAPGTP
jgi:glucose/arabinose dehydrogenase